VRNDARVSEGSDWQRGQILPASDHAVNLTAKPSLLEAIGTDVLNGRDPKAVANASLAYLNRYLRAEMMLTCLSEGNRLTVAAATGPHIRRLIKSKYDIRGILAELLRGERRTVNIPDAANPFVAGPIDELTAKLTELGARSVLMAPMGRFGLIVLADPGIDAFTSFDEAGVAGVATQLDYVFGRIYRELELEEDIDKLQTFFDSVSRAQSTGNLAEAMRSSVTAIVDWTAADSGSVLLFDKENKRLSLSATVGFNQEVENAQVEMGEGIAGWVALHKKPLCVTDLNGGIAGNGMADHVVTALSLPLIMGEDLVGVLNLGSKNRDHKFVLNDLEHITNTLSRIGIGIAAERSRTRWETLYFDTVRAMVRLIESRDPFYVGHAARVAEQATRLAKALSLNPGQIVTMELAALLHDIGTASIADDVLGRERPLTTTERLTVQRHPKIGKDALEDIEYLREVLPIILHHHEHYCGDGYLDGLKGDRIPLGARILAVSEAYVAMTTEHPYRPARSHNQALAELRDCSGTQFDPRIVEVFCALDVEN
jgi:HD-GYP domain-containing protein (c-di-GMP phosphodiesterase class II)